MLGGITRLDRKDGRAERRRASHLLALIDISTKTNRAAGACCPKIALIQHQRLCNRMLCPSRMSVGMCLGAEGG